MRGWQISLQGLWRVRSTLFRTVPGGGGIIQISFLDPQLKKSYEEAGSISFDDVCCHVVCLTPITFVLVYLFSLEGSNDHVKEALKYFGDIKEVKFQHWTYVPGVATGARIVHVV